VNLILFDPAELKTDGSVEAVGNQARHLTHVLRVQPAQQVRVGLIDGPMGFGTVTDIADGRVVLQCTFDKETPDRPAVDLLLALPRPKVMRRLWAQLAALGVGQVILTNAEKVERDYFDTHLLRPEGYRPLLLDGLQQARDTRVPVVSVHKQFRKLIESDLSALFPSGQRLVAHPQGDTSISGVLGHSRDRVLLAVGPEGGWNDFELSLLTSHGFAPVTMGPRTLTTTTACIALLTLVNSRYEPDNVRAGSTLAARRAGM
jgi:RsmE family RNA methyltransferase